MNNYYKFTKLIEKENIQNVFKSKNIDDLKNILDNNFNEIEDFLNFFVGESKNKYIFLIGAEREEIYYQAIGLISILNETKIILNILSGCDKNE